MPYEVLARKWRPQQFEDVVGQEHVTRTLTNAISMERTAHAYLLVGPRGIGKTSIARIFAKALNCAQGPTTEPCDKCDSCREITAGTNLDVLEIDGASNNGVEQVRDLRETVKYAPSHGSHKVYIIDEVHMLSTAAFNALLKTLEEPPSHVKFVFATTEPERVLPTIVSRCQRFDLRRIPVSLIVQRLRLIAKAEKVKVDDDALLAIARGSEGGLRDAESALDQLISFKGKKIAEDDVLSVFGLVSRETLEELGEEVIRGNVKELIHIVAKLDEAGKNLRRVVLELMEHFRNLLVCLNVDGVDDNLELTEAQIEVLKKQSELTDTARVLRVIEILSETENRMRYALSRRTLLETALIRAARAAVVVSLEEILSQINALKAGLDPGAGAQPPSEEPSGRRTRVTAKPEQKSGARMNRDSAPDDTVPKDRSEREPDERELPPAGGNDASELSMLRERWAEAAEMIGKIAVAARTPLVDARPASLKGNELVIAFDPEFAEERRAFEVARNRKAVEHVLGRMLKRKLLVKYTVGESPMVLKEGGQTAAESASDSKGSSTNSRNQDRTADKKTRKKSGHAREASTQGKTKEKKSRQEWAKDPAVRKALDVFQGRIVDVRE